MDKNTLDKLVTLPGAIKKGDPAISPYMGDVTLDGDPDIVVRPRDAKDMVDIVKMCAAEGAPLTVCGSRTSMTGSAAALDGVLAATEKMNHIISIGEIDGHPTATAEAGIPLGEFKKQLEEKGLFFPSNPTSVNEALLGATIATDATGDDSFKYGSSRKWVRKLKVVMADGSVKEFVRPSDSHPTEIKSFGGYYLHGPEIDRFIGSEGTLGVITEVTVDVLPGVPKFYSIMVPFPSDMAALKFIEDIAIGRSLTPRSLEFIGKRALRVMQTHETFPKIPESARALVYSHQEFTDDTMDATINAWLGALAERGLTEELLNAAIIAMSPKENEAMHAWRHHIPESNNEFHKKFVHLGGGKYSGDWWVPVEKMVEMMDWFFRLSDASGIDYVAYAHLGNGHPHTSYFTKNPEDKAIVKELIVKASARAVSLGGGVAGEHGIGKTKRHLLAIQHPQAVIDKMRALKTEYDPAWILGRGNILEP